ncbi:hypothetical protein AN72_02923, partial [Mycobacterium tuberculosis M1288]
NPERGRKRGWWASWRWGLSQVVRPKTPRGDGNLHPESPYARNASNVSSDPKPREGTETRNPAPHPQLRHAPEVVRPKTPRGDGNSITLFLSVARLRVSSDPKPREGTETRRRAAAYRATDTPGRQTQNPERGRKHDVRACSMPSPFLSRQTQNPERGRKPISGTATLREDTPSRQTQNPERGRKQCWRRFSLLWFSLSSDPKPREGTETR